MNSPFFKAFLAATVLTGGAVAQIPETLLYEIRQTGIGSNGFGTAWRGQDLVLAEDVWLTSIAFEAGSAAPNLDEIRLMTPMPNPTNLAVSTALTTNGNWVEATLSAPYYLLGGERYTIWFHQNGSPRGTYGCDLHRIDPSWGGHHTNSDPTQIGSSGEPSYFRYYQYGTNIRIRGYDNLEISPAVLGAPVTIDLQTNPNDLFGLLFCMALLPQPLPLAPSTGLLRVDPGRLIWILSGTTDAQGQWSLTFTLPNDPLARGVTVYAQGLHLTPPQLIGATSTMEASMLQ